MNSPSVPFTSWPGLSRPSTRVHRSDPARRDARIPGTSPDRSGHDCGKQIKPIYLTERWPPGRSRFQSGQVHYFFQLGTWNEGVRTISVVPYAPRCAPALVSAGASDLPVRSSPHADRTPRPRAARVQCILRADLAFRPAFACSFVLAPFLVRYPMVRGVAERLPRHVVVVQEEFGTFTEHYSLGHMSSKQILCERMSGTGK